MSLFWKRAARNIRDRKQGDGVTKLGAKLYTSSLHCLSRTTKQNEELFNFPPYLLCYFSFWWSVPFPPLKVQKTIEKDTRSIAHILGERERERES